MFRLKFVFPVLFILAIVGCEDMIVKAPESNKNIEDFDFAWQKINEVYPLLEYKKIDWDSIYTVFRPRAERAKGDEIYQVLHDLLAVLKDQHVFYLNEGGGLIGPYVAPRWLRDRYAFSPYVVRKYFDRELRFACRDKVEYEILNGNIGYIYIATFDEEGLMNNFYIVMDYMEHTKGLIIDVRHNNGGLSENIRIIVSRFIHATLAWPRAFTKGEVPYYKDPIQPDMNHFKYTNPVVILINGASMSGAELFPEVMNQLSNVTVVGDTTLGGGCNDVADDIQGDYWLPSGKYIHIGTTYVLRYDGVPIEWNGVLPDIRVPQSKEDIDQGRDKQLEYAIGLLR